MIDIWDPLVFKFSLVREAGFSSQIMNLPFVLVGFEIETLL